MKNLYRPFDNPFPTEELAEADKDSWRIEIVFDWVGDPVVFDPELLWCFAHGNEVFTHLDGSQVCARYMRSPCDVAEAAVVRMENE